MDFLFKTLSREPGIFPAGVAPDFKIPFVIYITQCDSDF